MTHDDRSTRARIRDAAITCIAELGAEATTARKVAAHAGVSAGSVINHFDSMTGLRAACDEYVVRRIREGNREAIDQGAQLNPLAAMQDPDNQHLTAYLAAVLAEDSPAVALLVDEMVADTREHLKHAEEVGSVTPTDDPDARAALVTMWSLGSLVLRHHVKRLLGVDPAFPSDADPDALAAYAGASITTLGQGMFTEAYTDSMLATIAKTTR